MNTRPDDETTIDLTLELRCANRSSTKFHESDAERVHAVLNLLAQPRLFAQRHLLLASEHCASMIPFKGIDMIVARTTAPLPLKFPLQLPAGRFDIVEQPTAWPDNKSAAIEAHSPQHGQPLGRNSRVEIHTLGGWTVTLQALLMWRGNVLDQRQFFSQLPDLPTIPFRLSEGGLGLINTANITRVTAWPKPETMPGAALPLACADGATIGARLMNH